MNNLNSNHIRIAQINPILGDIEFNTKKIAESIKYSELNNVDLLIFPEYALFGSSSTDLITHYPIIKLNIEHCLDGLAKLTDKTTVLVGYIDISDKFESAITVLKNGKIDYRLKKSSNKLNIINVKNENYGIIIGDSDINNINITNNLFKKNIDAFINCISSVSAINKLNKRKNILKKLALNYNLPVIQVNQSGAIDDYSFDGNSLAYNSKGALVLQAKSFEEDFITLNFSKNKEIVCYDNDFINEKFDLNYEPDLERTYKLIIQGIKDYFNKCGLKKAVLGLSGGLDSSVCAVLLADALGKSNVYGISLPTELTSEESKSDAKELALNLGINFYETPIMPVINSINKEFVSLFNNIEMNWNERYIESFTQDNIQARTRALYLWCISNEFKSCIPIATSDKSELYMGYATINGDMSGGFAPIADITKTKLFALAKWLNKNRVQKNSIPESVILKKPGAELAIDPNTGKTLNAEDALMPYEFLDEIIWQIENRNATFNELLNLDFAYETKNKISKEQKTEWLNKFYSRESRALYKWSILPPSIITDEKTINKNIYKQPVTSGNVYYKEYEAEYINDILK
ncbi:NAD(+) synthase [bacterium]|nr:NAD(+) synthase [bacterium]